jgi:hypothetical protein
MSINVGISIHCKRCRKKNTFEQPYPYHAGFSDEGFLYSDSGIFTLVWGLEDPLIGSLFPRDSLWTRSFFKRRKFERLLPAAPDGSRWRFCNPARCIHCGETISPPMLRYVQYLIYPGSIRLSQGEKITLKDYIAGQLITKQS